MERILARLVGLMALLSVSPDAHAQSDAITVDVRSLHNARGQVICYLYRSAAGFPQDASAALLRTIVPIAGSGATCRFGGVQPGAYAIAVVHDENSNGRLDRNFMGIPTEGVGASNDPVSHFGPPKFQDARFHYVGGQMTLVVHIHYL